MRSYRFIFLFRFLGSSVIELRLRRLAVIGERAVFADRVGTLDGPSSAARHRAKFFWSGSPGGGKAALPLPSGPGREEKATAFPNPPVSPPPPTPPPRGKEHPPPPRPPLRRRSALHDSKPR